MSTKDQIFALLDERARLTEEDGGEPDELEGALRSAVEYIAADSEYPDSAQAALDRVLALLEALP